MHAPVTKATPKQVVVAYKAVLGAMKRKGVLNKHIYVSAIEKAAKAYLELHMRKSL
jgi:hypothetical protein